MGRRDKRSKRKVTDDHPSEAERLCKLKNALGLSAKSDLSQLPEETTSQLYAMLDQISSFQAQIDGMTPGKAGKSSSRRTRRGSRQKGSSNAPTSATFIDRKKDNGGASDIPCSNAVESISTEQHAPSEGESAEDVTEPLQHLQTMDKQTEEQQCLQQTYNEWLSNTSKSLVQEVLKSSIVSEISRKIVQDVVAGSLMLLSVKKNRDVHMACVEGGNTQKSSFAEKDTSSQPEADENPSVLTQATTLKTGPGLENSKPVHLTAWALANKAQAFTVAEKNNLGLSEKSEILQLTQKTLQRLTDSSSLTESQRGMIKRYLHKSVALMPSLEQFSDGHRGLDMTNTSVQTRLQSSDEITTNVQVSPSTENPTLDQENKIKSSGLAAVPVKDKSEPPTMQWLTGTVTTTTVQNVPNTGDNKVLQNVNKTAPGDGAITRHYPSRLHQALRQARRIFEIPVPASSNMNPPPHVMSAVIGGKIITSLCCNITPVFLEYDREKSIKRCLFDSVHPSGEYAIFENMPTGHFLTICNEYSNGFIVPWAVGKVDPSCKHILQLCSGRPGNNNSVAVGQVVSADKQNLYDSTENKANKLKNSSKARDFWCYTEIPTVSRKVDDDFISRSREAQMQRMLDEEFRKIAEKFTAKANQPVVEDSVEQGSNLVESGGNRECWPTFHKTNRYFELPDDQVSDRYTVTEQYKKESIRVDGDCEYGRYNNEHCKNEIYQETCGPDLPSFTGGNPADDYKAKERQRWLATSLQDVPVLGDNFKRDVNSGSQCSTPQERHKELNQVYDNVPVSANCGDCTKRDGSRDIQENNERESFTAEEHFSVGGESSSTDQHASSEDESGEDVTASEQHLQELVKQTVEQCVAHAHNEWLANISKSLVENLVKTTIITEASSNIVKEAVAGGLMLLSVEDANRRYVENVSTLKPASLVGKDGHVFAKPCPYTGMKCKAFMHTECPIKILVGTSRTCRASSFHKNISVAPLVCTNKNSQGSSVEKCSSSQQDGGVRPAIRHKAPRSKIGPRFEPVQSVTWAFANNEPLFTVAEKNRLGLSAKSDILQLPKKTLEKLTVSNSLTERQRAVIKRHLYKPVIVMPSLEQFMNRLSTLNRTTTTAQTRPQPAYPAYDIITKVNLPHITAKSARGQGNELQISRQVAVPLKIKPKSPMAVFQSTSNLTGGVTDSRMIRSVNIQNSNPTATQLSVSDVNPTEVGTNTGDERLSYPDVLNRVDELKLNKVKEDEISATMIHQPTSVQRKHIDNGKVIKDGNLRQNVLKVETFSHDLKLNTLMSGSVKIQASNHAVCKGVKEFPQPSGQTQFCDHKMSNSIAEELTENTLSTGERRQATVPSSSLDHSLVALMSDSMEEEIIDNISSNCTEEKPLHPSVSAYCFDQKLTVSKSGSLEEKVIENALNNGKRGFLQLSVRAQTITEIKFTSFVDKTQAAVTLNCFDTIQIAGNEMKVHLQQRDRKQRTLTTGVSGPRMLNAQNRSATGTQLSMSAANYLRQIGTRRSKEMRLLVPNPADEEQSSRFKLEQPTCVQQKYVGDTRGMADGKCSQKMLKAELSSRDQKLKMSMSESIEEKVIGSILNGTRERPRTTARTSSCGRKIKALMSASTEDNNLSKGTRECLQPNMQVSSRDQELKVLMFNGIEENLIYTTLSNGTRERLQLVQSSPLDKKLKVFMSDSIVEKIIETTLDDGTREGLQVTVRTQNMFEGGIASLAHKAQGVVLRTCFDNIQGGKNEMKDHLQQRNSRQMRAGVSELRTVSGDDDVVSCNSKGFEAQPILRFNTQDIERARNHSLTSVQSNNGRTDNTQSTDDPASIGHGHQRSRGDTAQVTGNPLPNDRSDISQSTGELFPHLKNVESQSTGHSFHHGRNDEIQSTGEFLPHHGNDNTQSTGDPFSLGRGDETQRKSASFHMRPEQLRKPLGQNDLRQSIDDLFPRDKSGQTVGMCDPIPRCIKFKSQSTLGRLPRGKKYKSQITGEPLPLGINTQSTSYPLPRGRSDQTRSTGDLLNHSRSTASQSTGDPLLHVKSDIAQSTYNPLCIGPEEQRTHTVRSCSSSNAGDRLYTDLGQVHSDKPVATEWVARRLLAAVNGNTRNILKVPGATKRLCVSSGNRNWEWIEVALNAKPQRRVSSAETSATTLHNSFNTMIDRKVNYMKPHESLYARQFIYLGQLWAGVNNFRLPESLSGRKRDFCFDEDQKCFAEKRINLTVNNLIAMAEHSVYSSERLEQSRIELIDFCCSAVSSLSELLPQTSTTDSVGDSQNARRMQRARSAKHRQVSKVKQTNVDSMLTAIANSDKESLVNDHFVSQSSLEPDGRSLCQNSKWNNSRCELENRVTLLYDTGKTAKQLRQTQLAKTNRPPQQRGHRHADKNTSDNHRVANVPTGKSIRKRKRRSPEQFGGKTGKHRGRVCVDTARPTFSGVTLLDSTGRRTTGVKHNSSDDPTWMFVERRKASLSPNSATVGSTRHRIVMAKRPNVYRMTVWCRFKLYGQMRIGGFYIYFGRLLFLSYFHKSLSGS